MLAVRIVILILLVVAVGGAVAQELGRQRVARLVVGLAGWIHTRRRSEFRGELAMLQTIPNETGLHYAVGALFAATVERVTLGKALTIEGVSKTLGGTRALHTISLDVPAGSILALVGSNGAGKSTLINLIAGVEQPDAGTITFGGVDVRSSGRGGIAFVRPERQLFPDLDVATNLSIAGGGGRGWLLNAKVEQRRAELALAQLGVVIDTRTPVHELNHADRCIVAMARALQSGCELMMLDEPTKKLTPAGVARLQSAMNHVRSEGVGLVFASHSIDHVFTVADRVAVLHNGCLVHQSEIAETDPAEVVRHIVGAGDEASAA